MARTDSQGRRLCHATAKSTGAQCRAPAITGAMVCRVHGGSAGQVKAKAREVVLADLISPALLLLRDFLGDDSVPAATRLRAATEILARVGYQEAGRPSLAQLEVWAEDVEAELEAGAAPGAHY